MMWMLLLPPSNSEACSKNLRLMRCDRSAGGGGEGTLLGGRPPSSPSTHFPPPLPLALIRGLSV